MTDTAEYKRAQSVAKRRNNAARKKMPLFAEQLPIVTAEDVIMKRQVARAAHAEWRVGFDALTARHHSDLVARLAALVSESEFAEIEQRAMSCSFGARVGWEIAEGQVKRRLEPMTDDEIFVLALLCNQEQDLTLDEFYQRCGDGLGRDAMRRALFGLQDRGLAGGGVLRRCTVTGEDRAPWEATTAGRELDQEAA